MAASAQTIEPVGGANFVMSYAGISLFIGIVLLGHGGMCHLAWYVLRRIPPNSGRHPTTDQATQWPEPARPANDADTFSTGSMTRLPHQPLASQMASGKVGAGLLAGFFGGPVVPVGVYEARVGGALCIGCALRRQAHAMGRLVLWERDP